MQEIEKKHAGDQKNRQEDLDLAFEIGFLSLCSIGGKGHDIA